MNQLPDEKKRRSIQTSAERHRWKKKQEKATLPPARLAILSYTDARIEPEALASLQGAAVCRGSGKLVGIDALRQLFVSKLSLLREGGCV